MGKENDSKEPLWKETRALTKKGMSVADACRETGMQQHTYYNWRMRREGPVVTKAKKRNTKPFNVETTSVSGGRCGFVFGSATDIAEVLRNFVN